MHISTIVTALWMAVAGAAGANAEGFPADVDYLLRARRTFPNVINDAPEHGIDLQRLLVQRFRLKSNLVGFERPRDYVTIEVDDVGLRPLVKYDTTPGAIAHLASSFRAILATLPTDLAAQRDALLARVRAEIDSPSVGLIRFALWSLDQHDPAGRLEHFEDRDLDAFRTQSALKRRVRMLEDAIAWRHVEQVPGPFHGVRDRLRDGLFQTHRTAEEHLRDRVILAEMHPDLAVLKGLIGADCSSRCCFGYPYAPLERVFAVLDHGGEVLGYAAMSRTDVAGRAIYYVNCINGRRIGAHRTVMIFKALSTQLRDGVTQLGFPSFNGLGENYNFPEIRNVVRKFVGAEAHARQTFVDSIPRYRIQHETENHHHHYEAIYRNELVRLLPNSALAEIHFDVRVTKGSRFATLDPRDPTAREYFTAVLEAIGARQFQLARKLWFDLDGDVGTINRLTDAVTNARRDPEAKFIHAMEVILASYRIEAPRSFIQENPSIFTIGRLVAADSMTSERRDQTVEGLLRLLGKQRDRRRDGFWPALDLFLDELAPEARDELVSRALEARRRARKKIKSDQLYQIRTDEVYEDLLRLAGCEESLLMEKIE